MNDTPVLTDGPASNANGGDSVGLGSYIRDRRITLDLTKAEAARRAGVSRRTWHEVEDGVRRKPSAVTLSQFDQVLELPEGTLYQMTQQSADRAIEKLRQRAVNLVKLMTTDELDIFVGSAGHATLADSIRRLERDVKALRDERRLPPTKRGGA